MEGDPEVQGVVQAVGTIAIVAHGAPGLGKLIEQAMSQAILDANAEGISTSEENSAVLRGRMMAARQAVKDAYAEAVLEGRRQALREQLASLGENNT